MRNKAVTRLGWSAVLLGAASMLLLAVSAYGFRQNWWPVGRALDVATWAAGAAAAGALAAVTELAVFLRRRQGGVVVAVLGLVLSLPVLVAAGSWQYATVTKPRINDISTDTRDPPVFWFTSTPTDYPPANADLQRTAYPKVRPLDLAVPFDEAFGLVLALAERRGWRVLSANRNERQIEAIATSRLYGFEDEVAIRIADAGTGSRVDMRSRSRLGQIDRGANAARIEAFLSDLSALARP